MAAPSRLAGMLLAVGLLAACSSAGPKTGNGGGNGPASVAGTWTGSLTDGTGTPLGAQFSLQEQSGQLTGRAFFQDPVSGAYLPDDDVSGTRTGVDATWQTSTGLVVQGKFDADAGFAGTLTFPADDPLAIHVADLVMSR